MPTRQSSSRSPQQRLTGVQATDPVQLTKTAECIECRMLPHSNGNQWAEELAVLPIVFAADPHITALSMFCGSIVLYVGADISQCLGTVPHCKVTIIIIVIRSQEGAKPILLLDLIYYVAGSGSKQALADWLLWLSARKQRAPPHLACLCCTRHGG